MSQTKTVNFLNAVLNDDLAAADGILKDIMSEKLANQIRSVDEQLEEGFFDRLGARAAGTTARVGAKLKNFGTKFGSGLKAVGQGVTGDFKGAAKSLTNAQKAVDKNDPQTASKKATLDSITSSIETDLQALFPGHPALAKIQAALKELDNTAAKKTSVTKKPAAGKIVPSIPPKIAAKAAPAAPTKTAPAATKSVVKRQP